MNFRKPAMLIIALLLFLIPSPDADAQEHGIIQATATVIAGIVITGEHDLIFGMVLPDIDKTVDKSNVGFAGAWRISGDNSAEITLDFTLPDSLNHSDSSTYLRIEFSSTDASYDDGSGGGQSNPVAEIDPRGPNAINLGVTGALYIWIGGTVRPTIAQTGGDYASDITLTVAYTGN